MIENFQAIIGAKISDFNRKMKQVDKKVRETAFEATKPIGADIKEFQRKMAQIQAETQRVTKRSDKTISADISRFLRKAAEVAVVARALTRDKIIVPIQARWKNYQNVMGRIASFNRAMGEIMQMSAQGIKISLSPAIVPIIASLVGLLGQLGPMLGTIGGSTFALGTAFATAGIGAAAFGAIAVTNLKDVFGASSDLKKLQEKLDDTTDIKERAKIMEKMKSIQGSLNSDQTKALSSMNKLKETWTGIAKGLETKTIQIFTQALDIFGGVLTTLSPMFTSVTDAVGRLMTSLGQAVKSESMVAFFDYLNKSAGPMLETISKSVGNFFKGFFSMMEAFGPLAESTATGFLKMSEGFATWAAGLGESKKFQAFVDYVKENMPKIKSIFGDAILGIVNTFAAFAPSSAGMMTSLQDMMARFKEWSSTLKDNQGFQNFIAYIKENGPKVVDLIGNITTFLVNLGIALAPMGAFMLDMINRFLEWSSAMLENHPWLGRIMAAVVIMGGAFLAALPHILGMHALFTGLLAPMVAATGTMITTAWTFITKWVSIAAAAVLNAAKTAGAWLLMVGRQMATAIASMATAAATFIAKWALIAAQSLIHAAKAAGAWLIATGAAMARAIASMAVTAALFVAKWVVISAGAMVNAAKVAAAWLLSTGAAMATAVGKMIATAAIFVARWTLMAVQALIQAARMAAAWFIALGPVGWVIGAIVGLAILVIANWDKIKAATSKIWTAISTAVKVAWTAVKAKTVEAVTELGKNIAKMPGKVTEFAGKMLSAGGDLIRGLIDGIKGMAKEAIGAITGVVDGVVNKAKSLLGIKSPSRVFIEIGKYTGIGMANGITETEKANKKAITGITKVLSDVARNNAIEVTKIATDAEKARTAVQIDYAAKRAELNRKSEQSALTALKSATDKKGKTTSAGTQRVHNIHADAAVKLTKLKADEQKKLNSINDKAWDSMIKKESEMAKLRLDATKQFISDKKSLDDITLVAEANVWRRSIQTFREGSKERVEAQKAYRDTLTTINNEMIKASEDFATKQSAINSKLIADEESLTKAYVDAVNSRADAIKSFAGLFDQIKVPEEMITGEQLLGNLSGQVKTMEDWQRQIHALAAKGIDEGLLEELRQMGPKAVNELQALNSMTSAQLTTYSNLFKQKSAIARQEAEAELAGMKTDVAIQITELRRIANLELTKLKTDFIATITSLTQGTSTQLKTLNQIGKDAIKGLEQGMIDMTPALLATAHSIAESISAIIASALKVHSPSRVMMEIGGYVVQGLAVGLENNAKMAFAAVSDIATGMTDAFNPHLVMPLMDLQMAPLDTSSQVDSLKRQIKQELSVDMSVNHSGGMQGNGGGITQNIAIHSTTPLSPSEIKREQLKASRQLAMEWGV